MFLLVACAASSDLGFLGDKADSGAGETGVGDSGHDSADDSGSDSGDEHTGGGYADVYAELRGSVVTVADAPRSLADVVRKTPVSGWFAYRSTTPDEDDGEGGWYPFDGVGQLRIDIGHHTVTGSWAPAGELDGYGTFRFLDGTGLADPEHPMFVDGVADDTIGLWSAFTNEALFPGDDLPAPFPDVDCRSTPHTFSLSDDVGTVLVQLEHLGPKR